MTRLYFFVEGQTEQTFADTVLKPHLANVGVYMQNTILTAHARKKGKVHRGGGRNFQAMQNDIFRTAKNLMKKDDVYFTTMIDLYALYKNFPGAEEAEKLKIDPYRWVEALEKSWFETWYEKAHNSRFIPFIQLHEYESYLFCDVSQFEFVYENAEKGIIALQKIADGVESPELINDGQHTAPSKRIINEFPAYRGSKSTVGPQVAELIGLEDIRNQCPHFDSWLKKLESLGTE